MYTLCIAATYRLRNSMKRLRSLSRDDRGASMSVESLLAVVIGAFILLGILYIFRHQMWNGTQDLLEGFFDQGADTKGSDQNVDVDIGKERI